MSDWPNPGKVAGVQQASVPRGRGLKSRGGFRPERGMTNITPMARVDRGSPSSSGLLLWGAGLPSSSSGSDYLYMASTTGGHAIKWRSIESGRRPFSGQ